MKTIFTILFSVTVLLASAQADSAKVKVDTVTRKRSIAMDQYYSARIAAIDKQIENANLTIQALTGIKDEVLGAILHSGKLTWEDLARDQRGTAKMNIHRDSVILRLKK